MQTLAPSYLDNPVFISGYNKSGTTLFLSLLDGHPELVVIPEELHYFRNVLFKRDKGKAVKEKTGFRMFLSSRPPNGWSQGKSWFKEGYEEFDSDRYKDKLEEILGEERSSSEKALLLKLVQAFADVDGIGHDQAGHWVSKTTREEVYFPVILKMFGENCRFLYIVREPRDVYASNAKRNEIAASGRQEEAQKGLAEFCASWKTEVNQALRLQKQYANFRIFRYEDLLHDPGRTLQEICAFIGIKYSPSLLMPTRHGKSWEGNSVFSSGFQGLSQEPLNRYKRVLGPQTQAKIASLLMRELSLLGYVDDLDCKKTFPGLRFLRAFYLYRFRYMRNRLDLFLRSVLFLSV